jgi:hypothetical protein
MSLLRVMGPAALVAASVTLIPSRADAAPLTIHVGHRQVRAIGHWRLAAPFGHHPRTTLAWAIRAFGTPTTTRLGSAYCKVRWDRIGLSGRFTSLGAPQPGQTFCTPSFGLVADVTATGRSWRTWHHLRIGARASQIPVRHPGAVRHGGSWVLETGPSPSGGQDEPVVTARVRRGRVVALRAYVDAQGD